MAIGPMTFPLLSFEQANPVMAGINYASKIAQQMAMANQQQQIAKSMPQTLAEQLKQMQYENQIKASQAEYAEPMAQAELQKQQLMPGLLGAQTQETMARTGLTGTEAQKNLAELAMEKQKMDIIGQAMSGGGPAQQQAQNLPQAPGQVSTLNAMFGGAQQPIQQPLWQRLSTLADITGAFSGKQPLAAELYKTQQENLGKAELGQVGQYAAEQKNAADLSNDSSQMKQYIDQFTDAYDKSFYKGTVGGNVPSRGYGAILPSLAHDMTNEQLADNAAQNMQSLLLKLMKTNRLTNYELQFVGGLKLGRNMEPNTVDMVKNFLYAKSDRTQEYQNFINQAKQQGVDLQTAQNQWAKYENDRPIYDFSKRQVIKDNLNSSSDYLDPNSNPKPNIPDSVKKFYDKSVVKSGSNTVMIRSPDGRVGRIPVDKLDEAIKDGAARVE